MNVLQNIFEYVYYRNALYQIYANLFKNQFLINTVHSKYNIQNFCPKLNLCLLFEMTDLLYLISNLSNLIVKITQCMHFNIAGYEYYEYNDHQTII